MSVDDVEIHANASHDSCVAKFLSLLTPVKPVGFRKVRVGGPADGGYVMIDDFPSNPICYSLGIGGDVSWDIDMASRNAIVYQYDHSIDRPPTEHPNFRFSKLAVAGRDEDGSCTTLATAIINNGHQEHRDLILKMDIEDSEWAVLDVTPESCLSQFSQIVIEFHGLARVENRSWATGAEMILKKLLRTHLPVHVHGNNWGRYTVIEGIPVPDVLEVTYASRARYSFVESDEIYPTPLDRPCKAGVPDFFLGHFKFLNA